MHFEVDFVNFVLFFFFFPIIVDSIKEMRLAE